MESNTVHLPPKVSKNQKATEYAILRLVSSNISILTEEFAQAAADAGLRARREALASGHSVVFVDEAGRLVEETPDGLLFEVCFEPGAPRESHLRILGEIKSRV